MAVGRKDTLPARESAAEEILEAVRSEPALAWFLAQAVWIAQPALEIFWPQERITAIAELLESQRNIPPGGTDAVSSAEREGGN
jgi:hypothetical protein